MHKQLPIAQLFVFTFALFFAAANLAFAQYQNPSPKQTSNKHPISTTKKILPTPTKIQPTATPSAQPTNNTLAPTITLPSPTSPIALTTPIPPTTPPSTPTPTTNTPPNNSGLLINEINAYRASQGLPPVQTNGETCAFAATRAQEIISSFSHDGFNSRLSSHTLPYAHWSSVTENIAMTSNAQEVVNLWINSPAHAANMRADTPYVCVQQNGNYFAYEGMKP